MVHEENRHWDGGISVGRTGEGREEARRSRTFWASVLPDNRAMAGLFLAAGGGGIQV